MARRRPKDDDDEDEIPTKKKKKKRSREVDVDDFDDEVGDADDTPSQNNAFTGMLAVTLIAFIGAAVLLYLDSSEIEQATNIAAPSFTVPALGATAQAAPAN